MKKRLLAMVLSALMCVSLVSVAAFAEGTDVARIGDNGYASIKDAVSAASEGDTVEIIEAGTYTLPNISKNIALEGAVDGVVFNCQGSGSICSIPNGASFENVQFDFGNTAYHGFYHAGTISMTDCTLNGLLFSYSDMIFDGCEFNQTAKEYMMWAYSGDITYTDCTFNGNGKFINVYNEGNDDTFEIVADGCEFNSAVANKAAFNVKESCGNTALKYDVFISNCTADANFPEAHEGGALLVIDPLVQVDDRFEEGETFITVYLNGREMYPDMEEEEISITGEWMKNSKGWWFSCDDGSYLADGIYEIDGVNYAFNEKGYMVTGWYEVTDGEFTDWYHFASSGAMEYGWLKSGGKWYYLDPEFGYMWADYADEIDGEFYYFNESGAMVTGWYKYMYNETEFDWYHFASSGAMDHGWLKDGTKWYYLDPEEGFMWYDWMDNIDGEFYYFDMSGAMVTGWYNFGDSETAMWSHYKSSGALDYAKWVGDYYVDEQGIMATSSYIKNGDKYYWVNKDGKYTKTYSEAEEGYRVYDQATGEVIVWEKDVKVVE